MATQPNRRLRNFSDNNEYYKNHPGDTYASAPMGALQTSTHLAEPVKKITLRKRAMESSNIENRPFKSNVDDISEFPSLGAGSGTAQNTQQPTWGNQPLRATPQNVLTAPSSIQRLSKQSLTNAASSQTIEPATQPSSQQVQRPAPQDPRTTSPFPPVRPALEEYHFEDQGSSKEPVRTTEKVRGTDDFPPLSGLAGGDTIQPRRAGQTTQLSGLGSGGPNSGVLGSSQRNGNGNETIPVHGSSPSTTSADKIRSPISNDSQGMGSSSAWSNSLGA